MLLFKLAFCPVITEIILVPILLTKKKKTEGIRSAWNSRWVEALLQTSSHRGMEVSHAVTPLCRSTQQLVLWANCAWQHSFEKACGLSGMPDVSAIFFWVDHKAGSVLCALFFLLHQYGAPRITAFSYAAALVSLRCMFAGRWQELARTDETVWNYFLSRHWAAVLKDTGSTQAVVAALHIEAKQQKHPCVKISALSTQKCKTSCIPCCGN